MRSIKKFLIKKSSIMKSAAIIALGQAASYLVNFFVSPLLTRLYTPHDFGLYAIYLSILSILSVVIAARYDTAIIMSRGTKNAKNVFLLSLIIVSLNALLVFLVSFFGTCYIKYTYAFDLARYLWTLPLTLWFIGVSQILNNWFLRYKRYPAIALNSFLQKFFQNFLHLSLGIFSFALLGLILGTIAGPLVGIIAFFLSKNLNLAKKDFIPKWRILLNKFKQFKSFSLYVSAADFINAICYNLPTIFLTIVYGPYISGIYSLVQRLISVPVTLIAYSVSQVYLIKIVEVLNKDKKLLPQMFFQDGLKLLCLILPLMSLLFFCTKQNFVFIFGKEWGEAALYFRILSLMWFWQILAMPFGNFLLALNKEGIYFKREIIRLIFLVVSFIIGHFLKLDVISFLYVMSVIGGIVYIIYIIISWQVVKKYVHSY